MSADEADASQSMDEGGVGGPGAPTPLSALEVCDSFRDQFMATEADEPHRVLQVFQRETFNSLSMAATTLSSQLPTLRGAFSSRSRVSPNKRLPRY